MQSHQTAAQMVKEMTLQQKLGQMFVTGFPAESINDSFIQLVKEQKLGNVILFKANLTDYAQTLQLSRDLHRLIRSQTGVPPFITIDEEGGVVSRLPEDMPKMPSAMALSSLKDPQKVYRATLRSGQLLRGLGINFNLAPVLDINSNPQNPVIGIRSYGQNPQDTWTYAAQALQGYLDAGVMCSGKHFPGHGDTMADSHLELPSSGKTLDQLRQTEMFPFAQAVKAGLPGATIAHVVYSTLDDVPATMSRKIVTGLLRQELGFQGLIISDCMEMNAISRTYGIEEGVIRAVQAGIELIFVSHLHDKVRSSMEALAAAVELGRVPMAVIDAAVERILTYKQQYAYTEPADDQQTLSACRQAADELFRDVVRADRPFALGERPCFISPAQAQVSQVSNVEDSLCFAQEMQRRFGGRCVRLPLRPGPEDLAQALAAAEGATSIVMGTLNATVYTGQLDILLELEKLGLPMACVTFRNPFELDRLKPDTCRVRAWEYSPRALERVMTFFAK